MIEIPSNKQFVQTNRSDVQGNIVGSFNLDLTRVLGQLKVNRMIQTTSKANTPNASMTSYPVGFKVFDTKIWTVAGFYVHGSASAVADAVFAVDGSSGSPIVCSSLYSDIEVFNGALYVTTNNVLSDKIYKKASDGGGGGSWTTPGNNDLGASTGPHMMTAYANRLYFTVSGLKKIYSIDTSDVLATSSTNTLALDTDYIPTFIRAANNKIWIGTVAISGKAYIYEWDGAASQPTRGYRMEAQGALACVIKDDVPWIIDSNGRLMVYSNGTFIEKARLPISDRLFKSATDTGANDRFIHPNGMAIVNGKINILINNVLDDNNGSISEFCPSGVWEYDEPIFNPQTGAISGVGLYHKYSLSYLPFTTNAVTDFGQIRLSGVGGLAEAKLTNSSPNATGNILAGAIIYSDASNTDVGTFTNDTYEAVTGSSHANQGSGYFITIKIDASQIQDTWQKLVAFFDPLQITGDSIVLKFRIKELAPIEISGTWVSTSTFTTSTDVRTLVGYEVEGIQGTGSGKTAHITKVDVTAGLYTVTLDDIFTGVTTGTAKFRLQNWTKAGSFTDLTSQFYQFMIGVTNSWIQLKMCFCLTGTNEFSKALLFNVPQQLAQ